MNQQAQAECRDLSVESTPNGLRVGWLEILLTGAFLLPVAVTAFGGTFTRYMADDYCAADAVQRYGLLGSISYWYQAWSGRFMEWVFKGVAAQIGIGASAVLPALTMGLIFAASVWTLHTIARMLRLRRPMFAALWLASALTYSIVTTSHNLFQSFYWTGALVPYALPLALFIVCIGVIAHGLRTFDRQLRAWLLPVIFALTFSAGGASEVFVVFQLGAFALALVIAAVAAPPRYKRPALLLFGVGLLGTLVALAIMLAAPGVGIRSSRFAERLSIPVAMALTAGVSISFFADSFALYAPLALLSLFGTSVLAGFQFHGASAFPLSHRQIRVLLAVTFLVGIALIFTSLFPPVFIFSAPPPARIYLITKFPLLFVILAWGYLMGVGIKRHRSQRLSFARLTPSKLAGVITLGAVLLLGPISTTLNLMQLMPQLATYAGEWDAQDRLFRDATRRGERVVTAPALSMDMAELAELTVIGSNPNSGMNSCAARFYGLDSLAVEE